MTRYTWWVVVVQLLVVGHRVVAQGSAASMIPVDQEPRHTIVYADTRLRIIDLQVPPADTSLFHTHAYDNVTIRLFPTASQTQEWGKDWDPPSERPAGAIAGAEYAGGQLPAHRVRNLGKSLWRQIVVENVRTSGWTVGPGDPALAPHLERDTRSFRAYRFQLTGAASATTHRHAGPVVSVLVSGQAELGDGGRRLTQVGEWAVGQASTNHRLARVGAVDTEVVEVELR
jgi:hypothetical protein